VVECTSGSKGEVTGERKPVINDDDNNNVYIAMVRTQKSIFCEMHDRKIKLILREERVKQMSYSP
jgi:hypothetical protein